MANNYNFYMVFGSVPTMYAQINIFLDDTPSYIWYYRDNFFDINSKYYPKNLKLYYQTKGFDTEFLKDTCYNIKSKIEEIKKKDKKAKFNIFIDDSRVQFYLKPFILSDSIKDINNVIILSEGSISQYMYYDISSNDEHVQKKRWNSLIENIKNNKENVDNELMIISNYSFWLSTNKNIKYILPYYELLENKNVSLEYKNKMNLYNMDIEKMYDKLSYHQKMVIKGDFDKNVKIDKNKKYLVIIGTYDFGDKEITSFIYENLIDQALIDFGVEYTFLFKAHPLFPVSENHRLEEYLNNHDIEILPSNLPLEIFLWDNKNIMMGGFSSSIQSLIKPKRMKFVFGEKLGYYNLFYKNKLCNSIDYNIKVSQKLGYELILKYNKDNLKLKNLDEEIKQLKQEIKLLKNQISGAEKINKCSGLKKIYYKLLGK